jgi:hypothetical protein
MFLFFLSLACGPKKDIATPTPVESVLEENTVPETPEPPPPPPPPPPTFPSNVDFQVTLTFADGSSKAGHVFRMERSETFEGAEDRMWFDDEKKLRVELSTSSGGWQQTYWKDISEINVAVPRFSPNCLYSSDWIPWLYSCAVSTKSGAKTKDGNIWSIDTKYKYKMYFETEDPENPEIVAFWVNTHRTIQQDDKTVSLNDINPENHNLYLQLQKQLQSEIKTTMVTKIIIE